MIGVTAFFLGLSCHAEQFNLPVSLPAEVYLPFNRLTSGRELVLAARHATDATNYAFELQFDKNEKMGFSETRLEFRAAGGKRAIIVKTADGLPYRLLTDEWALGFAAGSPPESELELITGGHFYFFLGVTNGQKDVPIRMMFNLFKPETSDARADIYFHLSGMMYSFMQKSYDCTYDLKHSALKFDAPDKKRGMLLFLDHGEKPQGLGIKGLTISSQNGPHFTVTNFLYGKDIISYPFEKTNKSAAELKDLGFSVNGKTIDECGMKVMVFLFIPANFQWTAQQRKTAELMRKTLLGK
ncbi:MAG: hypothetical protein WCO56_29365 [Verrucomicrobiota bacterium]